MWNLVGNPEDRFSHNEAHMVDQSYSAFTLHSLKLHPVHYLNMSMHLYCDFYGCKNENFQMKIVIFFSFLLKT